ncbi:MAG TPA: hypothetical protein VF473_00800 [Cyclobacteriaceae bacterium]
MKALLTLSLICLVSVASFAQFNRTNGTKGSNSAKGLPLKDRVYFGGGGSFSTGVHPTYGLRYTYIAVSPLVGYRLTMPWSAGIQVMYQSYIFQQSTLNINQYGIAPFTQYRFGQLYAYAEYQMINAFNAVSEKRSMYTRLPIGLGFTQPVSTRAAINVVALYDVLYSTRSVYSPFVSPWVIRVYITAGGISF